MRERYETVVIGAGQAGLSVGYHLAQQGMDFVILDAAPAVGGSWRNRWDSMHLFTPSGHDGLPGTPFPARGYQFPSRDEMVAYLESYAATHELPVETGVPVDGLFREGEQFIVTSGSQRCMADNVIVCTGEHRNPKIPALAPELSADVVQMHSVDYRNPGQLREGAVLVVGPGNSGADIALDVRAAGHATYLSGVHPGQLPFRIEKARMLFPIIWWTWTHVLNQRTPVGRRARPKILAGHEPLIRVKDVDLKRAGVERVSRTTGVVDGMPQVEDGSVLEVGNVIWCTGFKHDYSWISLDGTDPAAALPNERGAVTGYDGLYVLGQEFQFAFNSHTVGGVGRDAAYVVRRLSRDREKRARAKDSALSG
jgi:putative flavoprotein involved in K+ transport